MIERQATEARITQLLEPVLLSQGYDLVRVQLQASSGKGDLTLQIMAERQDGKAMLVADCKTITTAIDVLLDEADPIEGAYALEVSSPGIDRPLTRTKDYQHWAGFEAKITLTQPYEGRKNFRGLVRGLQETPAGAMIQLEIDGAVVSAPFALVSKAQLVLTDALIKATAAREAAANGENAAALPNEKKPKAPWQPKPKKS
jgi:ribosome maturation factor RimP